MNRVLICALLYGLVYTAARKLSEVLGSPNTAECVCVGLYLAAVLWFLHRKNRLKDYRCCRVKDVRQAVLCTAPLLLLPICNAIVCVREPGRQGIDISVVAGIGLTCLSAFAEELLFRGVLPAEAEKRYALRKTSAAAVISAVFALMHFAGCFSGTDLPGCCLQAAFAFGTGFSFAALTERTESIVPAVVIHILVNLTAVETTGDTSVLPASAQYIFTALSVLSCCYGAWLFRQAKQGGNLNEAIH